MTQNLPDDPLDLFHEWLAQARAKEINDPEAMALATSTAEGVPSVRMVLLKQIDESGFKFHTNSASQKGNDLGENPHAALCFHWKSLRKQVRVQGLIKKASSAEADAYFESRPYARKIGAWASQQSRPLDSRDLLEEKIEKLQEQYPEGSDIPRPDYWVGYRLVANKIEFWWDNPDRLHDRVLYTRNQKGIWTQQRLYP